MNNNMNDITRVGLTANQLKNQFPSMAMKTVAASLQKELPMTLSGVQMKELNTTLQNAAYSKEMLEFQKKWKQHTLNDAVTQFANNMAKTWSAATVASDIAKMRFRMPGLYFAFAKLIPCGV